MVIQNISSLKIPLSLCILRLIIQEYFFLGHPVYFCICLSIFLCLVVGFRPRFHSVWSRPLCNCLVKKINQGTDVLTHKHTELPSSSFRIICSQASMYGINYIDRQWKQSQDKNSWKWPVGSRHSPLQLQIYFFTISENAYRIGCLYGDGVCEKVGSVVRWAGHYYWYYIHYVNQYACGFLSFLALLVFFASYFKIFNSLFSICQLYASFPAFLFTFRRPWKTGVFSVSPLACRRNAR